LLIWLVATPAGTADSEREWHTHNWSQRFVAVLLVGLAACDDTLSQRYSYTHIAAHVRAVPLTIEDVSASQI
jgi:hypothetical protein